MYQTSRPVVSRSTGCAYQTRVCTRPCLENYEFCLQHILEDKSAPYKLCNFVYTSNGRRCIVPTLKADKRESGFCPEHARKAQLARQKSSRRHVPPSSTETLLLSLVHYAKAEKLRVPAAESTTNGLDDSLPSLREEVGSNSGSLSPRDGDENGEVVTRAFNPFVEIDAGKVNSTACRILDYASESDSDLEVATFDSTWRGVDLDSSDTDSVDGSLEDPSKFATFRHAGIYTAEEVTQLTRDKLIRLQSLYIDQFRRLQHILKERRRKYLHMLKREKETLSNIHNQRKDSLREQKLYQKLKSLNRYQKRSGVEAVLHKKALERRALATEGLTVRPPPTAKCIFTEGGVKCGERTLPVAKHCRKHILQDTHQVLFRPCGCSKAGFQCREPVPCMFEGTSCVYHAVMPCPPQFSASHIKNFDEPAKDAREDEANEEVASRKRAAETMMMVSSTPNSSQADNDNSPMERKCIIKSETMSPAGQMVDGDGGGDSVTVRPGTPEIKREPEPGREKDPSESFNSETSTTETASLEESAENMEQC